MNSFTADPSNPRGRRSGSLAGSGNHDGHMVQDRWGVHELDSESEEDGGVAQEAGAGATELVALIEARDSWGNKGA
jgi:hypothetical protein